MASMLLSGVLVSQSVPKALEDWKTTQGTQNFFYKNITKTDRFGNVFVAGATMNSGYPDILVAKYNSSGVQLWIKQIAGTASGVDFAAGLFVNDTEVFICGAISNNSVTPETDCYTAKLASSTGSVVWSQTYDLAGSLDAGRNITVSGSGDVYVTGASFNSSYNADFLTLKYNSSGTQQWVNTWDYTAGLDDGAIKVALSGSNVNITGAVTSATNNYKVATLSLSQSTGSLLATSVSTAVTTTSVDAVTDMVTDGSGNVIIVGSQYVSGQGNNFYVQKLNASTLASIFTYTWNGPSSLDDISKAIAVDGSNNIYISGFSTSSTLGRELTLIKLNSSGVYQWDQLSGFSGDDEGIDLIVDASNDVYVTGYRTAALSKNYYTAKYNSAGTKKWEIETDGNSADDDNGTNITLDSLNDVIVTGQSKTPTGDYEFLTVKYAQKDIITPTDFNGEVPSGNFMYYRNTGQIIAASATVTPVSDIKFYTHNTYPAFYFKDRSQSFVFAKVDSIISTTDTLHRIDLDFTLSDEKARTYPLESQESGYLNYVYGHLAEKVTNVKGNQRLITKDLYSNIDLMYSSNEFGAKYYFIVKPGGDPRDIQMEFTGASSYSLDGTTNNLTIHSSIGSLTYDKPIAYQLTAGNATVAVTGWNPDWQTNGASNKYKFNSGSYTSSLTLVIEVDHGNGISSAAAINNLNWSTYYGAPGDEDYGYTIKNDNSGNIYVGGYSADPAFPTTAGAYQTTYATGDGSNGVLMKFNSSRQLQWATYFGGSSIDQIRSLAFDNISSQIYACGYTWSSDFPIQNKSGAGASAPFHGYSDAFIASFSLAGMQTWSNLYGTTDDERGYSIYIDNSGNKFITGYTSNNLTQVNTTAAYYMQGAYGGGFSDGFIGKINSTDNVEWMTFYGGNAEDYPMGVTGDASGNIFVWGHTASTTFNTFDPGSGAVYNTTNSGGTDFFILKFGPTGSRLWATLYGGELDDLAAETDGIVTVGTDVYCFGTTLSTHLPLKAFGSTPTFNLNGTQDCYIVCFDNTYKEKWATYFGGSNEDYAGGITKDVNNNILITGSTASSDFITTTPSGFYSQSYLGPSLPTGGIIGGDAFITSFSNVTLAPAWSTFIGGNNHDAGFSISATSNNKLFITGTTLSKATPYPVVTPPTAFSYAPNTTTGNGDILISEFNISNTPVSLNERADYRNNSIYPNPFVNTINVQGFSEKAKYEVFDVSGKLVMENLIKSDQNVVNLSNLKSGIYLFKIINNNGDYETFKVIKQD